jgi:hypothetical protein
MHGQTCGMYRFSWDNNAINSDNQKVQSQAAPALHQLLLSLASLIYTIRQTQTSSSLYKFKCQNDVKMGTFPLSYIDRQEWVCFLVSTVTRTALFGGRYPLPPTR